MTDPEITRVVRSWLEEGATRMPDRVLDSVLDQLPTTPQRRSWRSAWRSPHMTSFLKVAVSLAAVVLLVAAGIVLAPKLGQVAAPAPTPSPTASSAPIPAASPLGLADGQARLPGAYHVPTTDPFTITLSSGWAPSYVAGEAAVFDPFGAGATSAALLIDEVKQVFTDPCYPDGPGARAGGTASPSPETISSTPPSSDVTTVDETVLALGRVSGFEAGQVTDLTLGGHAARTFILSNAISDATAATCFGSPLDLWQGTGGLRQPTRPGARDRIWVVDVNGTPITIDAQSIPGVTSAASAADAEQIATSIRFDR